MYTKCTHHTKQPATCPHAATCQTTKPVFRKESFRLRVRTPRRVKLHSEFSVKSHFTHDFREPFREKSDFARVRAVSIEAAVGELQVLHGFVWLSRWVVKRFF